MRDKASKETIDKVVKEMCNKNKNITEYEAKTQIELHYLEHEIYDLINAYRIKTHELKRNKNRDSEVNLKEVTINFFVQV
jgi:ribosome-interacting GTPase 1